MVNIAFEMMVMELTMVMKMVVLTVVFGCDDSFHGVMIMMMIMVVLMVMMVAIMVIMVSVMVVW